MKKVLSVLLAFMLAFGMTGNLVMAEDVAMGTLKEITVDTNNEYDEDGNQAFLVPVTTKQVVIGENWVDEHPTIEGYVYLAAYVESGFDNDGEMIYPGDGQTYEYIHEVNAVTYYYKLAPKPVITVERIKEVEVVPFETKYIDDNTLEVGKEIVVTKGVNGEITRLIKITYEDGVEIKRTVSATDVTIEKHNEIVLRGTKVIDTDELMDETDIEYETIYELDDTLEKGEWVVKTEGVTGKLQTTILITYENGVETNREIISEIVTVEKVDEVILVGTKVEDKEEEELPDETEDDVIIPDETEDETEETDVPKEETEKEDTKKEETKKEEQRESSIFKTDVPHTGISRNPLIYTATLVLGLAALAVLVVRKKED